MVRNKRPLVGVALLFCAGILLGTFIHFPSTYLGVVIGLFCLLFFALYRTKFHSLIFYPLATLAGFFAYQCAVQIHNPADLRLLVGDSPEHVALRGVVCDWPETRLQQTPRGEFGRTSMTLEVDSIRRGVQWQPASGKVLVHSEEFQGGNAVAYGDELELDGSLEQPPTSRNPGQFDYRRYLARQNIYYQYRLTSPDQLQVLRSRCGNPVMQIAAAANEYFKKCLSLGIERDPETVGLMWAIVLGFRPGLTNELSDPFMKTGTLHVFAVSGFHIALVGSILVGALRFCRFSRTVSGLVSIPLLFVYTLITGAPASAVRSFTMAAVVIFGYSLLRPTDIFNSLAAAAIIVLAINPQQLFDAGFQLSFFVVLAIALFTPRVKDSLLRWSKPDPFLPWEVLPKWRRLLLRPLNHLLLSLSVSIAAVLGSAPLIAHYFGLVTPIAFVSNLVVVPLSGLVIGLGFISMLTGSLVSWATASLNNANYLLLHFTLWLNDLFARVPLGYWTVSPPPWFLAVMYYSLAGAVLSGWTFRDRSSRLMTIVGAVAFIIAGSAFYLGGRAPTLTALDVGGGQAVVIDQPGDNDLLVDGGRRSQGDSVVRTFLRMRGMDRLHTVLLTVNDINHAGGLISTVQHVRFGQFCESGFKSRSKDHKELVELLSEDHSLQILKAGMEFDLSPSLRLKILHPTGETRFATADDNSVVFQLICEQLAILFKSDIGESVEKTLVANGADLRSRILITSQHPKETCCIDAFLDRVKPEVVILNAGSFPTYAYPRQEVVERLQRRHIRLYRTDECGGIVVTIHRGSYTIRPTIEVPGDMQRP